MLALLTLPIELMRLAFYALQGVVDALRARNRLHLKFTVLVNAPREAVWRLIEYEPDREQNIITILISELPLYSLLQQEFAKEAEDNPGYDAKLRRLNLRRPGYDEMVLETYTTVCSHIDKPDWDQWQPAWELLNELGTRYRDAFSFPPPGWPTDPNEGVERKSAAA